MSASFYPSTQREYARLAGVAYLIIIVSGILAEFFIRGQMIVPGDPAATATNILASETLFRLSLLGDIIMIVADAVVAVALFMLLRNVHEGIALLAALFRVIQGAILGANALNQLNAVSLLSDSSLRTAFQSDQVNAFALYSLESHGLGYVIGLAFFAVHCLLLGVLLVRSDSFPHAFGYLFGIVALGYIVEGFVVFLFPHMREVSYPGLGAAFLIELSFALWLVIRRVPREVASAH